MSVCLFAPKRQGEILIWGKKLFSNKPVSRSDLFYLSTPPKQTLLNTNVRR